MCFEAFAGRRGWTRLGRVASVALMWVLAGAARVAHPAPLDATVVARGSSGPLRCEIRAIRSAGSVSLSGMLAASSPVAGVFRLSITKTGPAGSSTIDQSDRFDVDGGKDLVVGHVQIGLEQNAQVTAELNVQTGDGPQCRAAAPIER